MPEVAVKIYPAGATPRRVDVDHGSGERTAGARDQIAVAAIQDILRREDYQPRLLKDMAKALANARNTLPPPNAMVISGKVYSLKTIEARLAQFIHYLPADVRPEITDTSFYDENFLNQLISTIDEVSGLPAEASAEAGPPPANIPKDLKALVAEFENAHQAAVSAQAKRQGWSPEKFRDQIALQNQITIQMGVVRQATLSQLGLVIDNSQYLENLAASLGVPSEAVKRLAKIRLQTLVDQAVTAQTFRQARLISKHTSQLAGLFTKNLSHNLKFDDLVGMAVATNKKDAKKAIKKIQETAAAETEKAKPAIAAAAENLARHPSVQKAAQADAIAAVKQTKSDVSPAKAARLNSQLVKHQNNPDVQEKLISKTFNIPPSQAKLVLNSLRPSLSQLAASAKKLNPLLAADPDSIAADALRRPNLFPKPFVDAIKSGKITDAQVADIFHTARLLDIPPNAVILSRFGVNAKDLAANLQAGKKWLGIIPMGHGLDPKDASVVKLSYLADTQQQLIKSLESPPPLLPEHTAKQFLSASRAASRRNGLSEFLGQINIFRLPSAFSYNLGRLPPLGSLGNAGSSFISGLRVQSGPINSFFNFISSAGNTIRQAPSFLTAPLRAVGGLVNQGWQNVKTWAGTKVKSGLAKAGAWLAKKGITEGAKKLGLALVGKGGAALLAQAVPVVGQIAGVLMLLSTLGDIGKFLWQNRKTIGLTLGGLFFLGQMLLGKLIGFLSSLGTVGLTTGIGALIGTMIFPGIGTAIGAGLGFGAGLMINAAGGLGAALSGLGSALGSAAASLSSFIGAITAPSAFIGLGSTVATAGLLGVGAAWFLQTFFIQPTINSAMFVPSEKALTGPSDGNDIPPIVGAGTCPLVENPSISTGSLGSGLGRSEHGGRGYGFHCYGIPIKSVWRWDDDPRTIPKSNPATGTSCDISTLNSCNDAPCPYYGFATDVESTSNANPTIRLPIICSDTGNDISQCQPMTWKVIDHFYNCYGGSTTTKEECEAKDYQGVPKHDQLWGWGTIFESHDNGHYWRLYLNHYEKTANVGIGSIFYASLEQADTIGYIPADAYVKHVHIELVMDDNPIRPDFLCDGSAEQPPVNTPTGWVAKVNGANNLVATTNMEYTASNGRGQPTCSWMDSGIHDSVTVAANANFWGYVGNTKSPRGPASYQNDPINHSLDSNYEFWTVYVDGGSTRLAPAETDATNHLFAVSGAPLLVKDGTITTIPDNLVWNKRVNRVGFGFTSNTYYLVFLQNAYVADLQAAMINLGVKNAINLDGGSKASLCSRSAGGEVQKIVSQGASVPVSVGLVGGTIEPYLPTTTPTPTPPRFR